MKPRHIKAVLLGLSSLMAVSITQAADIEAGKSKTLVCAACHGADGNSVNPIWPRLAGQHASYIAKQLRDFKTMKRMDPTMQGMAATVQDADIDNIAAYFESQKRAPANFDKSLLELGQNIYRGGIAETSVAACMSCHSPSGSGNGPAGFPSLKGQHPEYIVTQLQKFKDSARTNDSGKMMRGVANRMSDKEMKAVAAYIAAMK
jgi:cytochrome c553